MERVSLTRLNLDRAAMCQLFIKTAVVNINRLSEKKFNTHIGAYTEASRSGRDVSLKRQRKSESRARSRVNSKKRKTNTTVSNEENGKTSKLVGETNSLPSQIPVEVPKSSEQVPVVSCVKGNVPITEKDDLQVSVTNQSQWIDGLEPEVSKPRDPVEVVERSDEEFEATKNTGSKKKPQRKPKARKRKKTTARAEKRNDKLKTPMSSPSTGLSDHEVAKYPRLCPITGLFDGETAPAPIVPLVTIPLSIATDYRNLEMELLEPPEFISTGLEDDIFSTIAVEENTIDVQDGSQNKPQSPKNVWPSIPIKPEFISTCLNGDDDFPNRFMSEDSRVIPKKEHCDGPKVFVKPEVMDEVDRVSVIVRQGPSVTDEGADVSLTYYESRLSQAKNRITSFMKESTEQRLSNFAVHIAYAWVEFLVLRSLYNRSFNAGNYCIDQKVGATMQSRFGKLLDHIAENQAFLVKCSEELKATLTLQYFLTRLLGAVKNISDGENFVFDNDSCMKFYEIVQGNYMVYFSACFPGVSISLRNGDNRTDVSGKALHVESVQTNTEEYSQTNSKCLSNTYETTQKPSNEINLPPPTDPCRSTVPPEAAVPPEPSVPLRRKSSNRDQPPKSANPSRHKASANRKQTSLFQKSLKDAKVHASMLQTPRQLIVNINQNFQTVRHEPQEDSTTIDQYPRRQQITQVSGTNPVSTPQQNYGQVESYASMIAEITEKRRLEHRIKQGSRQIGEDQPTERVPQNNFVDDTSGQTRAQGINLWQTDLPARDMQHVNTQNGPLAGNSSALYTSSSMQRGQLSESANSSAPYPSSLMQRGSLPVNVNTTSPYPLSLTQHSSVPPSYSSSRMQHSSVPPSYSSSLTQHSSVPPSYSSSRMQHSSVPPSYSSSLTQHSSVPVSYSSSLTQHSSVPPSYSSSLTQHSTVPPSYSSSLTQHSSVPPSYSSAPTQHGAYTGSKQAASNSSAPYSSSLTQRGSLKSSVIHTPSRTLHDQSPATMNSSMPYTSSLVQNGAYNSSLSTTANNHTVHVSSLQRHTAQDRPLPAPASSHSVHTSLVTPQGHLGRAVNAGQTTASRSSTTHSVPTPRRTGTLSVRRDKVPKEVERIRDIPVCTGLQYVPCPTTVPSKSSVTSSDTTCTGGFDYRAITRRAVDGYQENNPRSKVPSQNVENGHPNMLHLTRQQLYDEKLLAWMRNPSNFEPASTFNVTPQTIARKAPLPREGIQPAVRVDQSERTCANMGTSAGAPVVLPKKFTSVVTITQDTDGTTISTSRTVPAKPASVSQQRSTEPPRTVATLPGLEIFVRPTNKKVLSSSSQKSENALVSQKNLTPSTAEQPVQTTHPEQSLLGALLTDRVEVYYKPGNRTSGNGGSSREETTGEPQVRNLAPVKSSTDVQRAVASIVPTVQSASRKEDSTSRTEANRAPERKLPPTVQRPVDRTSSITEARPHPSRESAAACNLLSASTSMSLPVQSVSSRSEVPRKQAHQSLVAVQGVQRTASIPTPANESFRTISSEGTPITRMNNPAQKHPLMVTIPDVQKSSATNARPRPSREIPADCNLLSVASSVSQPVQSASKTNEPTPGNKKRACKQKLVSVADVRESVKSTLIAVSVPVQSPSRHEELASTTISAQKPQKQTLQPVATVQEDRRDVEIIRTPTSLPVRSTTKSADRISSRETNSAQKLLPMTVEEILRRRFDEDVQKSSDITGGDSLSLEALLRTSSDGASASAVLSVMTSASSASGREVIASGHTMGQPSKPTLSSNGLLSVANSIATAVDDDVEVIEELSAKKVIPVIALDDDDEPEVVSSTVKSKTCAFCHNKATGQCSDCMDTSYCSKSCMERHWFASHHLECAGRRKKTKKAVGNKPATKAWNATPWC